MNVIDRARAWIAQDPDPNTREELEALIRADDRQELEARFQGELEFGTAGLRGVMGAGATRMNRVNVMRATHGLCTWMKQEIPDAQSRGLCIAHDARLLSDTFARDVIEVALGAGFVVWTYSRPVPTPLVPFALLELEAAGGVVVTASHNPPEYNGYKVFWENGAQIIPPHDRGIAQAIEACPPVDGLPRIPMAEARKEGLLKSMDRYGRKYVRVIAEETCKTEKRRTIQVAYTALHGVAYPLFRFLMSRTGFCKVATVREQARADGTFPTVPFPNPEEPGAMDRVLELAREVDAVLALANDPDGDRLAVAVRHHGSYRMLSGNDTGILLANDLLERYDGEDKPLVISTVVSSPMLGPVAAKHGATWEQTLTGHKWIQNRALDMEQQGYRCVFGYEEALGYAAVRAVRDKDGVSAAMLIIDLASRLHAEGRTLIDALDDLWRVHGVHVGRQHSVRYDGPSAAQKMEAAMDALRENPPPRIGGRTVESMLDLKHPQTRFAPSDGFLFDLGPGHAVMVRPSGTEPKVKYYLYAKAPVQADIDAAHADAEATLDAFERDWHLGG